MIIFTNFPNFIITSASSLGDDEEPSGGDSFSLAGTNEFFRNRWLSREADQLTVVQTLGVSVLLSLSISIRVFSKRIQHTLFSLAIPPLPFPVPSL